MNVQYWLIWLWAFKATTVKSVAAVRCIFGVWRPWLWWLDWRWEEVSNGCSQQMQTQPKCQVVNYFLLQCRSGNAVSHILSTMYAYVHELGTGLVLCAHRLWQEYQINICINKIYLLWKTGSRVTAVHPTVSSTCQFCSQQQIFPNTCSMPLASNI